MYCDQYDELFSYVCMHLFCSAIGRRLIDFNQSHFVRPISKFIPERRLPEITAHIKRQIDWMTLIEKVQGFSPMILNLFFRVNQFAIRGCDWKCYYRVTNWGINLDKPAQRQRQVTDDASPSADTEGPESRITNNFCDLMWSNEYILQHYGLDYTSGVYQSPPSGDANSRKRKRWKADREMVIFSCGLFIFTV